MLQFVLYVFILATPSKPTITSVDFDRATAVVTWRPGYDGGYPQQLEVWYRLVTDNDYEWRRSSLLQASVTSYKIPDLQPELSYYFSIRGINREGAGYFSDVVEAKGAPPVINRSPDKAGNTSSTPFPGGVLPHMGYVPRDRVGFLRFSGIIFAPVALCSLCDP